MLATWGASKSLAARVRDIFAKYGTNAHMYLAGTEITQGFTPGNYVESTGVTPATVDQPVGLVLDAAGSVGASVAVPSNSTTGWASAGGATLASVGNEIEATFSSGNYPGARYTLTTVVDKTYRVKALIRQGTTTSPVYALTSTGSSKIVSTTAPTYVEFVFKATATTMGLSFLAASGSASGTLYCSGISYEEITGIHASQSTSGFRPVERRGIVNLLTQSEFQAGLTDAPARGGNISLSSIDGKNAIAFATGADSYAYKTLEHTNGVAYTFACVVQMDDGNAPTLNQTNNGTSTLAIIIGGAYSVGVSAASASLGSGKYLVYVNWVSTGVTNNHGVAKLAANDSRTFKVTSYGLFAGTLTASQILAMGGIPLTTTAAASSAMGPYYLEHKAASTQFLTLGSNPIGATLTQPYTIVVAGIVGSLGVDRYMCGDLARAVGVSNLGLVFVAHGGNFSSGMSAGIAAGSTLVVEVTYDGSLLNVWINGVKKLTNFSLAASGSAAQPFALGQRGNNTGYWDGGLYPSFVTNYVLPDADRRLIAKQIAQLAGVTL